MGDDFVTRSIMGATIVAHGGHRAARAAAAELLAVCPPGTRVHWTTPDRPAVESAAEAIAQGARDIIAVGGDGTIQGVVAAALPAGVVVGIVPTGRGNVVAHNLGLRRQPRSKQLAIARRGREREIPVAQVALTHAAGVTRCIPCLAMAGVGHDAEAVASLRGPGAWWRYFAAGAARLGAAPLETSLGAAWSVFVGNLPSAPPGIELFPDLSLAGTQLQVARVHPQGAWGWPGIAAGRLLRRGSTPGYSLSLHDVVTIECPEPLPVHVDGEVFVDVVRLEARRVGRVRIRQAWRGV